MFICQRTRVSNVSLVSSEDDCKSPTFSVNYRQLCFTTYERQLTELCRDFVEETCDK